MNSLRGKVFQSGVVEFLESENEWAFKAMRSGKMEPGGRVVLDPAKAPIQLAISEKATPDKVPWFGRLQKLLDSADRIYLKPVGDTMRFQQSVHRLEEHVSVRTLAGQDDVDRFAATYWQKLKYFYATKVDNIRFDLKKIVTHRITMTDRTERIELATRMFSEQDEDISHVTFDATGSGAPNDIIDWRGTVKEGETGRFAPANAHCRLSLSLVRRPLTFVHEYRQEFKCHAYEFEGDQMNQCMRKIEKRMASRAQQSIDLVDDGEEIVGDGPDTVEVRGN